MKSFQKNAKPKIITYFKILDSESPSDDVLRFMERLDKEIGHYYNIYEHVDTLKLGMIMQIKLMGLDGVDARFENCKIMQGNDEIMSLNNIGMILGHEDLQKLKSKLADIESKFFTVKASYLENPDDNDAYEAFIELSTQRSDIKNSIQEMEKNLYSMIEGMYEHTAQGNLSKRQIEAYRLMERGKYNEARQILDFDEIVSESRNLEATADKAMEHAQVHVSEQLQLVEVNKTLLDWEAVDNSYKEAVRLEERFDLPKKAMLDYVIYLVKQNRYDEGEKLGKQLLYYYQNPRCTASNDEKGELYIRLGDIYDYI